MEKPRGKPTRARTAQAHTPQPQPDANSQAGPNSSGPNPQVQIRLLGGLHIRCEGRAITAPGGKPQQLLARLLLEPQRAHPREQLAELLWPDASPDRSRRNLSDALYRLRQMAEQQMAGIDLLVADSQTIAVRGDAPLWVDVWELASGGDNVTQSPDAATRLVELYRGPLLPEFYEDWLGPHRAALHERYLNALLHLAGIYETSQQLDAAYRTLQAALQADPLRETAYAQAMRVLAKLRRVPDALNLYDQLVDVLEREVAAPPSAATRALADALFRELELERRAVQAQPDDLWRPHFVGRRRERSAILAAVESATRGQGTAIAVDGPAGMGKTRLLEEIEAGAQWRGATVVWGRADERPGSTPLGPLAAAVGAALAGPRAAQLATLLDAPTRAALGPLFAPWQDAAPLVALPPQQAQQRFVQAVRSLFATLCDLNPLVLILDDLHWADPSLWQLVDEIVSHCSELRLAALLGYRRAEVQGGPGWDHLQGWEREKLLQVYTLAALDAQEVAALLGTLSDSERATHAEAVWAGSGGNPFLVVQALAALAEGATPTAYTMPARIHELPAPARATLELAAVLGRTISYPVLAAVSALDVSALGAPALSARALIDAGEALVARHFIAPIENGYRFIHDLVQAAVYAEIEPERRRELHRQVAQVLAELEPDNLRSRAYHLEEAGELAAAGTVYVEAARQQTARFAFAEARTALTKALDYLEIEPEIEPEVGQKTEKGIDAHPASAPDGEPGAWTSAQRTELLLELARLANLAGDVAQTASALQAALDAAQRLQRPDLELTSRVQLADLAARTGRHDEAEAGFSAAWQLAQARGLVNTRPDHDADAAVARLEVLLPWSDFLQRVGRFADARANFVQAIELARAHGDKDREGRALEGMGWVLAGLGHSAQEVIGYFEQALAAHQEGGNRFEEARTRLNLFSALQSAGKWDRLLALEQPMLEGLRAVSYRRGEASAHQAICWVRLGLGDFAAARTAGLAARALFEEIGEQMGASLAISALGAILMRQGARAEAQTYLEQALGITKELGSDHFEAYAHYELGVFYWTGAHYAEAAAQFEAALECWERSGDPFNRVRSQTRLAQVYVAQGARTAAAPLADAAWTQLEQGLPDSESTLDWLLALYELFDALQSEERAQAVITQAYAELLRQARAIDDLDVRRQFLENVPVNRAIAEAYAGSADRATQNAAQITVRLARADAPLGRAVHADELVDVVWTLVAPIDATIDDRTARRRHVLQRLHAQALAQNALPTDDDLALALDVSRRTILRDIQALAETGIEIRTRARRAPG